MQTFRITSSAGVDMGSYQGETAADALDAMARDAGYTDSQDAAKVAGEFDGKIEAETSKAAQELGRKGGSVKSAAKTAAVQANGARGGRPQGKTVAIRLTNDFHGTEATVRPVPITTGR